MPTDLNCYRNSATGGCSLDTDSTSRSLLWMKLQNRPNPHCSAGFAGAKQRKIQPWHPNARCAVFNLENYHFIGNESTSARPRLYSEHHPSSKKLGSPCIYQFLLSPSLLLHTRRSLLCPECASTSPLLACTARGPPRFQSVCSFALNPTPPCSNQNTLLEDRYSIKTNSHHPFIILWWTHPLMEGGLKTIWGTHPLSSTHFLTNWVFFPCWLTAFYYPTSWSDYHFTSWRGYTSERPPHCTILDIWKTTPLYDSLTT